MAENFVDVTSNSQYNLNYSVGEQSNSVNLLPMHGDPTENLDAVKAVADLIGSHVDASLQSVTQRIAIVNNPIPDDSSARLYPTRFNFTLITGEASEATTIVQRLTLFIPWYLGGSQSAKKALGDAIAAALSGSEGTYAFKS